MLGGDRPPRARAAPEAPPSGTARSYALMRLRQEQISARGELVATSGGYTARWASCVPAARKARRARTVLRREKAIVPSSSDAHRFVWSYTMWGKQGLQVQDASRPIGEDAGPL